MFDEDFELPKLKSETPSSLPNDEAIINVTPDVSNEINENNNLPELDNSDSFSVEPINERTIEIPVLNNEEPTSNIFNTGETIENKLIEPENPELNNVDNLAETAFGNAVETNDKTIENFNTIEPINFESIPAWEAPQVNEEIKPEINQEIPTTNTLETETINNEQTTNPPLFSEPTFNEMPPLNNEQVIQEPILNEPTLEFNNQIPESINLDDITNPISQTTNLTSEGIETLDISNEVTPTWEAPVIPNQSITETVVYDTPDASIAFQVDGNITPNVITPPAPGPDITSPTETFGDYIEPIKEKKDPIIILSTLLIIASLIMAAVYFFMTQNIDLPFAKTTTTTTTTTTTAKEEPKTWPVDGRYMESESKICPDKPIELTLNTDNSFVFKDLTYDSIENKCTDIEITGTYQLADGKLTLTTSDNKTIIAQRKELTSHAEIIITATSGIEITLYRTVHNAS